jgi:hypothetical protein
VVPESSSAGGDHLQSSQNTTALGGQSAVAESSGGHGLQSSHLDLGGKSGSDSSVPDPLDDWVRFSSVDANLV